MLQQSKQQFVYFQSLFLTILWIYGQIQKWKVIIININSNIIKLEMIMDRDSNTNSSLQIVQPQNAIDLSSSDSNRNDLTYDKQLDYSRDFRDESSLSFHIEDERKQSINHSITINNQPPKRKRKEIFDKYKVPPLQVEQSKPIITNSPIQNDIMKAFDQIFSMGTPRSLSKDEQSEQRVLPIKNFSRKIYAQQNVITPQIKPMQQQQFNIVKTPQKNVIVIKRQQQSNKKLQSPQKLKQSQFFKTPLDLSKSKQKQVTSKKQFLNLSQLQYRLSFIQGREQIDNSYDSAGLSQILGAEIFRDKQIQKNQQNNKIVQTKPKVVQNVTHVPVTINIKQNKESLENNMGLSRFSDVYQRIDMTQSMASSVVFRDPQNRYNQANQFFDVKQNKQSPTKNFSRNGSSGTIGFQQQTLINALSSKKIIQQAQQQQRVPIYMRKAVRLNSSMPNFFNPTVQYNLDRENQKLQQIVNSFSNALNFLQKMLTISIKRSQLKKQLSQNFANGITLNKFKTFGWQKCNQIEGLDQLRPHQNLFVREWNEAKVGKALDNYKKIIQNYKGIVLNFRDERGITKYFQIRKKIWDIQKNMLMITDDIYSHILSLGFPKHFTQFKQILDQNQIMFQQNEIRIKKIQLQKIKRLRNKGDQLSLSEVGCMVISKLVNQIKFNSTNY